MRGYVFRDIRLMNWELRTRATTFGWYGASMGMSLESETTRGEGKQDKMRQNWGPKNHVKSSDNHISTEGNRLQRLPTSIGGPVCGRAGREKC